MASPLLSTCVMIHRTLVMASFLGTLGLGALGCAGSSGTVADEEQVLESEDAVRGCFTGAQMDAKPETVTHGNPYTKVRVQQYHGIRRLYRVSRRARGDRFMQLSIQANADGSGGETLMPDDGWTFCAAANRVYVNVVGERFMRRAYGGRGAKGVALWYYVR